MEINKFYKKYLKYKQKYLSLKNLPCENINQKGGDDELIDSEQENYIIEQEFPKPEPIKDSEDNFDQNIDYQINKHITNLTLILDKFDQLLKQNKDQSYYYNLENQVGQFITYLEKNDVPLDYSYVSVSDIEESLTKIRSELNHANLSKLYQTRNHIYKLNEINYPEILDWIINKYLIANAYDIEKLFKTSIFGFNKNYVIAYMVLLRFLIKNKFQLSLFNDNITYLSYFSLWTTLDSERNADEYIPIVVKLINEYIMSFPIKKVINIKHPEQEKENKSIFSNNLSPIQKIDRYDVKNKIVIYQSANTKSFERINYDDIKQILYNLFRIHKKE
jgi:hypothetical protein